ncbi:hypothetical protein RFI_37362 [Reticulomyxa filosa]|uniref:TRAF-type domain-containing protein n=1 Tax=Reticulomyxa filosa TaxID=46433 RepID=X6LG28_RETFI|nr:hypothetical protein RFI_37362 [Reticulomyxa filosa]|eukprot:ETO00097.1 hypothetical protein RFI_37362 [Reticulomyxa filosa]
MQEACKYVFVEKKFQMNYLLLVIKAIVNRPGQCKHFICLICKQVANYLFEIHCQEHKDIGESFLVGESCLKQFLDANSNSCPIQHHTNYIYYRSDESEVTCPLQFRQDLQQKNEELTCNFKGKVKDLDTHLNNVCPLKMLDCYFILIWLLHLLKHYKFSSFFFKKKFYIQEKKKTNKNTIEQKIRTKILR